MGEQKHFTPRRKTAEVCRVQNTEASLGQGHAMACPYFAVFAPWREIVYFFTVSPATGLAEILAEEGAAGHEGAQAQEQHAGLVQAKVQEQAAGLQKPSRFRILHSLLSPAFPAVHECVEVVRNPGQTVLAGAAGMLGSGFPWPGPCNFWQGFFRRAKWR
jgi:hypothetical protein